MADLMECSSVDLHHRPHPPISFADLHRRPPPPISSSAALISSDLVSCLHWDSLFVWSPSLSPYIYTQIEDVYGILMARGHPSRIWSCASSERIIYLKLTDCLLLVVARSHLELFPAQGEAGVVQERFRLDSERRREYTGRLESVCQIDCCSC